MTYFIDLTQIKTEEQLYQRLAAQLNFPDYFGNNLDALWDVLTGDLPLPASVHFIDIGPEKITTFSDIIRVFEDAQQELGDAFEFTVHPLPNEIGEEDIDTSDE